MKFIIFLIMIFVISALLIISNNGLALSEPGNFKIFLESYVDWADQISNNSKLITSEVVKLSWAPEK